MLKFHNATHTAAGWKMKQLKNEIGNKASPLAICMVLSMVVAISSTDITAMNAWELQMETLSEGLVNEKGHKTVHSRYTSDYIKLIKSMS